MAMQWHWSPRTRSGRTLRRALAAGGVTAVAASSLAGSASAAITTVKPPSGGNSWVTFNDYGEVFKLYDHQTNGLAVRLHYYAYEGGQVWRDWATTGWETTLNLEFAEGTPVRFTACDYNPKTGFEACSPWTWRTA